VRFLSSKDRITSLPGANPPPPGGEEIPPGAAGRGWAVPNSRGRP
jgi:hypothetical protein